MLNLNYIHNIPFLKRTRIKALYTFVLIYIIQNFTITMSACDNILFTYKNDEFIGEIKDPLEDLDIYPDNPKYYRLNETVFAEPFEIGSKNAGSDAEEGNEICFIDNFVVRKRTGKRNKYLIDVDRNSSQHKCPQTNCNKIFSTSTLLRAHIRRVHCAERTKYVCECCGAGFSAGYLLQRHMAVHSRQQVECPVCGKTLSRRTNMSVHLQRHADVRPHACSECDRTFVRRAALSVHVRAVHRAVELGRRGPPLP